MPLQWAGSELTPSPQQRQSVVHVSPVVLHLHFFVQVGSALQPHLTSSLQPTATAGSVVQTGRHPLSSVVHPKPSGLGVATIGFRLFIQILVWYKHRFAALKQCCVCGRKLLHRLHLRWENILPKDVGCGIRTWEGMKKGQSRAFSCPRSWQIELTWQYRKCCPVPKAIHNYIHGWCWVRSWKIPTKMFLTWTIDALSFSASSTCRHNYSAVCLFLIMRRHRYVASQVWFS